MKKFFMILLCAVILGGAVACSKDNPSTNPGGDNGGSLPNETYSITYYVVDDKGEKYDWDKFGVALKIDGAYPTTVEKGKTAIIDSLIEDSFTVQYGQALRYEFKFLGWYANEECSELLAAQGSRVEISLIDDISVYAKLERKSQWLGPL